MSARPAARTSATGVCQQVMCDSMMRLLLPTWNVCAVPLRRMPTVSWQGLLSVSRSAVAARIASMRGLQRLLVVRVS